MIETIIGSIAAALTTSCFIPQAWKTIRTRNTKDISLAMYVLFTAGVICWLAYGITVQSAPIIIANIITFFLSATILVYKFLEKKP